ncbi:MAG: arsenic resistance protein [Anaerolineae bacterium]|nr:arsenic resistance protein [Anaerolineae bacterium]
MWAVLTWLKANLIWSIPAAMLLGLGFGALTDPVYLKSLILPLTFLMVYPMMVNLQIKKVLSGHDYRLQATALFINFGIVPFVAFGIGRLFFSDNVYAALGLLLAATLPTSGMTISWTGFAKGNLDAAIKMAVIGLFIGALATPLYANWLMGAVVEIPLAKVFQQIAVIVFLPMILGYATQRLIVRRFGEAKYRRDIKPRFPLFSTLGVLGIVFVAMALKANTILSNPSQLLLMFVPLLIFYGITFVLGTVTGKLFFGREDAIALVYGTAPKNLSIALAIAMIAFGQQGAEIALIIALAYVIQIQTSAWCNKLINRCFGEPEQTESPSLATERA